MDIEGNPVSDEAVKFVAYDSERESHTFAVRMRTPYSYVADEIYKATKEGVRSKRNPD